MEEFQVNIKGQAQGEYGQGKVQDLQASCTRLAAECLTARV